MPMCQSSQYHEISIGTLAYLHIVIFLHFTFCESCCFSFVFRFVHNSSIIAYRNVFSQSSHSAILVYCIQFGIKISPPAFGWTSSPSSAIILLLSTLSSRKEVFLCRYQPISFFRSWQVQLVTTYANGQTETIKTASQTNPRMQPHTGVPFVFLCNQPFLVIIILHHSAPHVNSPQTSFPSSAIILLLSALSSRKEGYIVISLWEFCLSVGAGVVAHYVCKWLDRK